MDFFTFFKTALLYEFLHLLSGLTVSTLIHKVMSIKMTLQRLKLYTNIIIDKIAQYHEMCAAVTTWSNQILRKRLQNSGYCQYDSRTFLMAMIWKANRSKQSVKHLDNWRAIVNSSENATVKMSQKLQINSFRGVREKGKFNFKYIRNWLLLVVNQPLICNCFESFGRVRIRTYHADHLLSQWY